MWEKKNQNAWVILRWSGRESELLLDLHTLQGERARLWWAWPARAHSWAPGPLTTSQVRASQCQHRHLPQNSEWHRRGRGLHLQAVLILVELFMQRVPFRNRRLPNTWAHQKILYLRENSLHSCLHSSNWTRILRLPLAFSAHLHYSQRLLGRTQLTVIRRHRERNIGQKRLTYVMAMSKDKRIAQN